MDASVSILIVAIAGGCFAVAAWPIVCLPRFRPLLAGASGSLCALGGVTAFGLVAGGLVPLPTAAASIAAASDTPVSSSEGSGSADVESLPDSEVPGDSQSLEEPSPPGESPSPDEAEATSPRETADSDSADSDPADNEPVIESSPTPIIPPGRPAWVESEDVLSGPVHSIHVSSEPYVREADANRALDERLVAATNMYIADHLGSDLAPQLIRYDAETIRRRFIQPDNIYREVITFSVGDMHQVHALLEFDAGFRQELQNRWTNITATSRLSQVGLFAGGVLLLLGSVFGYFRLDNATRGYYTGRLQFMAAAAILTIVGAGALVARWITWL